MPHKSPDIMDAYVFEIFRRAKRVRPLVRVFAVPESVMRGIPLWALGDLPGRVKPGERVVLWIDPNDLASQQEAVIMKALHAVIKLRRESMGARSLPSPEALEMYRRHEQGESNAVLAKSLLKQGADDPNGSAQESALRRVKRLVRQVRDLLRRSAERERAGRTAREQEILEWHRSAIESGDLSPVEPAKD